MWGVSFFRPKFLKLPKWKPMTCLNLRDPIKTFIHVFFNRVLLRGIIAKHAKTKTKTIRLGGFNHLEQIWKSMGRIIPYMKWKISAMIETTNQYTYCHGKKKHGMVCSINIIYYAKNMILLFKGQLKLPRTVGLDCLDRYWFFRTRIRPNSGRGRCRACKHC